MAKELGPRGVHVAHVVIDGPVDGAFVRSLLPEETLRQASTFQLPSKTRLFAHARSTLT